MKPLFAIAIIAFIGCGHPDHLTYLVSCGECRVRYTVGDSINQVNVQDSWNSTITVSDGQLYGIHVDNISGEKAAYARISLDGDAQYLDVCTDNATCDLNYVGQVKLPWWAK